MAPPGIAVARAAPPLAPSAIVSLLVEPRKLRDASRKGGGGARAEFADGSHLSSKIERLDEPSAFSSDMLNPAR
jgi:hypothetical protein